MHWKFLEIFLLVVEIGRRGTQNLHVFLWRAYLMLCTVKGWQAEFDWQAAVWELVSFSHRDPKFNAVSCETNINFIYNNILQSFSQVPKKQNKNHQMNGKETMTAWRLLIQKMAAWEQDQNQRRSNTVICLAWREGREGGCMGGGGSFYVGAVRCCDIFHR